jgi:hypothetical protein
MARCNGHLQRLKTASKHLGSGRAIANPILRQDHIEEEVHTIAICDKAQPRMTLMALSGCITRKSDR